MSLFERVREYLKQRRLPAPDKRAGEQRENHDGTDQNRLGKAGRPTSEEDPERYDDDNQTSDQSLGHTHSILPGESASDRTFGRDGTP